MKIPMNMKTTILVSAIAAGAIVSGCVSSGEFKKYKDETAQTADSLRQELKNTNLRIDSIQTRIDTISERLTSLGYQGADLKDRLDYLEMAVSAISPRYGTKEVRFAAILDFVDTISTHAMRTYDRLLTERKILAPIPSAELGQAVQIGLWAALSSPPEADGIKVYIKDDRFSPADIGLVSEVITSVVIRMRNEYGILESRSMYSKAPRGYNGAKIQIQSKDKQRIESKLIEKVVKVYADRQAIRSRDQTPAQDVPQENPDAKKGGDQ